MAKDLLLFTTDRTTGRVSFGFQRSPKTVTGTMKLAQEVMRAMLTTPGKDKFQPEMGVGSRQINRFPLDDQGIEKAKMEFVVGLSRSQSLIVANQKKASGLVASERLASLSLSEFTGGPDGFQVRVRMLSDAGEATVLDLTDILKG